MNGFKKKSESKKAKAELPSRATASTSSSRQPTPSAAPSRSAFLIPTSFLRSVGPKRSREASSTQATPSNSPPKQRQRTDATQTDHGEESDASEMLTRPIPAPSFQASSVPNSSNIQPNTPANTAIKAISTNVANLQSNVASLNKAAEKVKKVVDELDRKIQRLNNEWTETKNELTAQHTDVQTHLDNATEMELMLEELAERVDALEMGRSIVDAGGGSQDWDKFGPDVNTIIRNLLRMCMNNTRSTKNENLHDPPSDGEFFADDEEDEQTQWLRPRWSEGWPTNEAEWWPEFFRMFRQNAHRHTTNPEFTTSVAQDIPEWFVLKKMKASWAAIVAAKKKRYREADVREAELHAQRHATRRAQKSLQRRHLLTDAPLLQGPQFQWLGATNHVSSDDSILLGEEEKNDPDESDIDEDEKMRRVKAQKSQREKGILITRPQGYLNKQGKDLVRMIKDMVDNEASNNPKKSSQPTRERIPQNSSSLETERTFLRKAGGKYSRKMPREYLCSEWLARHPESDKPTLIMEIEDYEDEAQAESDVLVQPRILGMAAFAEDAADEAESGGKGGGKGRGKKKSVVKPVKKAKANASAKAVSKGKGKDARGDEESGEEKLAAFALDPDLDQSQGQLEFDSDDQSGGDRGNLSDDDRSLGNGPYSPSYPHMNLENKRR